MLFFSSIRSFYYLEFSMKIYFWFEWEFISRDSRVRFCYSTLKVNVDFGHAFEAFTWLLAITAPLFISISLYILSIWKQVQRSSSALRTLKSTDFRTQLTIYFDIIKYCPRFSNNSAQWTFPEQTLFATQTFFWKFFLCCIIFQNNKLEREFFK